MRSIHISQLETTFFLQHLCWMAGMGPMAIIFGFTFDNTIWHDCLCQGLRGPVHICITIGPDELILAISPRFWRSYPWEYWRWHPSSRPTGHHAIAILSKGNALSNETNLPSHCDCVAEQNQNENENALERPICALKFCANLDHKLCMRMCLLCA